MPHAPAFTALSTYKVLDRARAGPTAVRQLADWGAQVLKIKRPGSGDASDFALLEDPEHVPDITAIRQIIRSHQEREWR